MIDPGEWIEPHIQAAYDEQTTAVFDDAGVPRPGEADHGPASPTWECAACGQPWPCDVARKRIGRLSPSRRTLLMASYMGDAAKDRPWEPAGDMYDRFIAWTRDGR